MFSIPTSQIITLAKKEAKITHFDEDAGNGSAIVIMLVDICWKVKVIMMQKISFLTMKF